MPNKKHTAIQAKSRQQNKNIEISGQVIEQSTDSPYLPVEDLANLHTFKPEAVDWFMQVTDEESKHRRGYIDKSLSELKRVNTLQFAINFVIPIIGLLCSVFVVENTIFRSIIGGIAVGGIVITSIVKLISNK